MVPPRYPTRVERTPGISLYAASTPQKQPAPKMAVFASFVISSMSIRAPYTVRLSCVHVLRQKVVEVMRSHLAPRRKTPAIVKSRAYSPLNRFHDFFVLHLDLVD